MNIYILHIPDQLTNYVVQQLTTGSRHNALHSYITMRVQISTFRTDLSTICKSRNSDIVFFLK